MDGCAPSHKFATGLGPKAKTPRNRVSLGPNRALIINIMLGYYNFYSNALIECATENRAKTFGLLNSSSYQPHWQDLVLETVAQFFGSAPPVAARLQGGRCLVLSNGRYELERCVAV